MFRIQSNMDTPIHVGATLHIHRRISITWHCPAWLGVTATCFSVPPVGLEPMTICQTDESDPIIPDPACLLLLYSMTIAASIRISYKART